MIKLAVTSTPDISMLAEHTYQRSYLSIGSQTREVVMVIADPTVLPFHLALGVSASGAFIHEHSMMDQVTVNKKRAYAGQALKKQDIIVIGQTEIRLVDFMAEPAPNKSDLITKNLGEIQQSSPSLFSAITSIRKKL